MPVPITTILEAKRAIRAGISDVWGNDNVPESVAGFEPHLSMAYSNAAAESTPILAALAQVPRHSITVELGRPQLIKLHRDHRMYQWEDFNEESSDRR